MILVIVASFTSGESPKHFLTTNPAVVLIHPKPGVVLICAATLSTFNG